MAPGLWPALERGGGKGKHRVWGMLWGPAPDQSSQPQAGVHQEHQKELGVPGAFTGMYMYVCPLHLWMHAPLYQLQGQLMGELCSGDADGPGGQAAGWYPPAPPYWELRVH